MSAKNLPIGYRISDTIEISSKTKRTLCPFFMIHQKSEQFLGSRPCFLGVYVNYHIFTDMWATEELFSREWSPCFTLLDHKHNPNSIKFKSVACHRQSFTCEEQMTSSIRSLTDELLSEYHNNHYESKTLEIKDNRVSTTVTKSTNMSPGLSSEVIAPIITPDIP